MTYTPAKVFKQSPADTLAQAKKILLAWEQIPDVVISGFTLEEFRYEVGLLDAYVQEYNEMQTSLSQMRDRNSDQRFKVWDISKRTRRGIGGIFGIDSGEYGRFGGKRWSTRGRNTDKNKADTSSKTTNTNNTATDTSNTTANPNKTPTDTNNTAVNTGKTTATDTSSSHDT